MRNVPTDPPELPLLVPVRAGKRMGPFRIGAAIVVAVGVVAFGAGYRLGSAQQPVAALPVVTAAPNVTAPPPSVTPAPSPDFSAMTVSQRLRGAISAAGTGDYTEADVGTAKSLPWVICAVDGEPRCDLLAFENLDRAYTDVAFTSAEDWPRLSPVTVTGMHFILAAVLEETIIGALIVDLDSDPNFPYSQALEAVDPEGRGIDFLDLGLLTPGRYIVAAGGISPTILYGDPSATPNPNLFEPRSDIAALIVREGAAP
jgi:hypothetical protein